MIISVHTRTVIQNERFSVKYEPVNTTKTFKAKKVKVTNSGSSYNSNGTWQLIIRQLKESDKGCYMCQINTSPMISQLGCLDILGMDICNYKLYSGLPNLSCRSLVNISCLQQGLDVR